MRRVYLKTGSFFERYEREPFKKNRLDNFKSIIQKVGKQLNVVDGIANQSFAINVQGWIMSDIALLAKASTQQELDYALSRLREVGVVSSNNEGKSISEIINGILPRFVQTPSELTRYAQFYADFSGGNVVVEQNLSRAKQNVVENVTDSNNT